MTKHKQFEEYLFHDAYYFCHCVKNILCEQISYIRDLNYFHGDGRITSFSIAFPKYSHFHAFIEFIEFIVSNIYYEELEWSNIQKLHKRFKDLTLFELAMLSNSENGGVFSLFNKYQEYMVFYLVEVLL